MNKAENDHYYQHDDQKHNEKHAGQEEFIGFRTLEPFAFSTLLNKGVALEVLTLSPHAFINAVLGPEALVVCFII